MQAVRKAPAARQCLSRVVRIANFPSHSLRWQSSGAVPVGLSHTGKSVTLGDLLSKSKPVVTVSSRANVQDVVDCMTLQAASTVFVEDAGFVVGIVKESDVIHHVDERYDRPDAGGILGQAEVSEIMRDNITFGFTSSSVRDSLLLLDASRQDHLPILTEGADPEAAAAAAVGEPFKVEQARVIDVTSIISAKQIIGQFYSDTLGVDPFEMSVDEREIVEAEATKNYKFPTVKDLMKTRQKAAEADGKTERMVLNTLLSDEISVLDCIQQMVLLDKGSVAIMDMVHDVPVLKGIATEQDIVRRALHERSDLESTLIADIMTHKNLATVSTKCSLLACAFKMIDCNVRHLPVVNPKGTHILGMVSSKDLVSFFCEAWQVSLDK